MCLHDLSRDSALTRTTGAPHDGPFKWPCAAPSVGRGKNLVVTLLLLPLLRQLLVVLTQSGSRSIVQRPGPMGPSNPFRRIDALTLRPVSRSYSPHWLQPWSVGRDVSSSICICHNCAYSICIKGFETYDSIPSPYAQ